MYNVKVWTLNAEMILDFDFGGTEIANHRAALE